MGVNAFAGPCQLARMDACRIAVRPTSVCMCACMLIWMVPWVGCLIVQVRTCAWVWHIESINLQVGTTGANLCFDGKETLSQHSLYPSC